MKLKNIAHFLLIVPLVGCALMPDALMGDRSYTAEMEDDSDEGYFRPREDFPVVPGDQGRYWRSRKDIRRRTPASLSARMQDREDTAMENQLAQLESAQSEGAARHYQHYRNRLGSTSEKIYFLQLRGRDAREEYLTSRGLMGTSAPINADLVETVQQEDLALNMSKDEVVATWGRPDRVDVAGKASYENERWMYHRDGAVKYVYFEGGQVGGWTSQNRRPAAGQDLSE